MWNIWKYVVSFVQLGVKIAGFDHFENLSVIGIYWVCFQNKNFTMHKFRHLEMSVCWANKSWCQHFRTCLETKKDLVLDQAAVTKAFFPSWWKENLCVIPQICQIILKRLVSASKLLFFVVVKWLYFLALDFKKPPTFGCVVIMYISHNLPTIVDMHSALLC